MKNDESTIIIKELELQKKNTFDEAWEDVRTLYVDSIEKLKKRFEVFKNALKAAVDGEITADREFSDNEWKSINEALAKADILSLKDLGDEDQCTYPIIYLHPSHDLSGNENDWEDKILVKDNEYWVTITQPENKLLHSYFKEEFEDLLKHYNRADDDTNTLTIYVGKSKLPIPLPFALELDGKHDDILNNSIIRRKVPDYFTLTDLALISDAVLDKNLRKFRSSYEELLNKTFGKELLKGKKLFNTSWWIDNEASLHPLTFFGALRTDFSLNRLKHYTHTRPEDFQPFVLFTNYEKYVKAFIREIYTKYVIEGKGKLVMSYPSDASEERYIITKSSEVNEYFMIDQKTKSLGLPKDGCIDRSAQMPTFHYVPFDSNDYGITLINIGVGPSNAKNITDHLAVLRPICWLMLGHCGGLRYRQQLGQFVLAQSYIRDDEVLDDVLPKWVPIPVIWEIQEIFERVSNSVLFTKWCEKLDKWCEKNDVEYNGTNFDPRGMLQGYNEYNTKRIDNAFTEYFRSKVRTGVVYTTADRNWELQPNEKLLENLELSRAVGIEMESATIAGNGFRYRIPYATFLCVSDRPLHGEIKMRNMADSFYLESTELHLKIALEAIKMISTGKMPDHTTTKLTYMDRLKKLRRIRGADDPVFR